MNQHRLPNNNLGVNLYENRGPESDSQQPVTNVNGIITTDFATSPMNKRIYAKEETKLGRVGRHDAFRERRSDDHVSVIVVRKHGAVDVISVCVRQAAL